MFSNPDDLSEDTLAWRKKEAERKSRLSSLDFLRLRWEVREGPIKELIYVLQDVRNSDSEQQPFFTESGFHEIADSPATMAPMAEIQVALAMHQKQEPPFEESGVSISNSDALDPPEHAYDDGMPPLKIIVTPGDERRNFVSIKDYVLAVHDWFVSWRPDILQQNNMHHSDSATHAVHWPEDTRLWLIPTQVDYVGFFNNQSESLDMDWKYLSMEGPIDREPLREARSIQKYEYKPEYPTELLPDLHFANSHFARPSLAFLRLRWTIPRPSPDIGDSASSISKSISVLEDVYDPASTQVPFQDQNGQCHEIATLPFSRPPRRELEVTIDRMDGCQEWKLYTEEEPDSPLVEDPDSAPKITVRAGDGRDFISVGDYVNQVHPWLVALRPQMLKELGLTAGFTEWEEDTQLWINPIYPEELQFFTDAQSQEELDGSWQGPARFASQG